MIGFIVGVFIGAMAGVILIGLVSLNRFEEQEQPQVELDITPQLVQTSWEVVKQYLRQCDDCDKCVLKKEGGKMDGGIICDLL